MASCVLSATMGNYGLLRQIHLKDDHVVSALDLWDHEALGKLGFLPLRTSTADRLDRTLDNRFLVRLSTDAAYPAAVEHDPNVAPHWRCLGKKALHYWRAEADAVPIAAVNGRH
jgi:hypothetical protein